MCRRVSLFLFMAVPARHEWGIFHMTTSIWLYVGFTAFVLGMLALDLGVFHKKAHVVRGKEAGIWVAIWMAMSLLFATALLFWRGADTALLFLTGYLIEQS